LLKRIFNKNISDSFWYTFGEIINKTSVFLLIPFYTTYFTKEEYGILSLVIIFTTISNHIISYGSKTALLRLIYDYSIEENKRLIFTVISNLFFILVLVLFCLIIFHFISYKFDLIFFNYFKYCYFICFHSFFFSLINIGLTLIRVDRKVKYFTAFNLLKTVTEIVLIFFFVKFLSDGVFGKIIGSLVSVMVLSLVIYFVAINKKISFSYSRKMSKDYFYFATPLVINNIIGWTLVSYDQFLFQNNFGLEQLAILALVFQICSIYKFSMEGILRAFNVYLYEKIKTVNESAKEIFVFFI
jgi:O-antigen/teichoic acid export membrane protein